MKRYIITALYAFVAYYAWGQLNAPCFTIPIPDNTPTTYSLHHFTQDSTVIDLDNTLLYALAISGEVTLQTESNSSVKVILIDNYGVHHLVYEVNSLLADTNCFTIENVGRETLWDNPIYASQLLVRLNNASLTLNAITPVTELLPGSAPQQRALRTQEQNDTIVAVLNRNLIARDIPWRAGTTNLSDSPYDVRRGVLGDNNPFDNIEYYIGGYYVDPAFDATRSAAVDDGYVEEFDWRNRHGKNWITPAKQQWNNDCWAFAAIATGESYINLYYNDIKNIDLSEQQLDSVVQNSTFAEGGYVNNAHMYMTQNNLVTEYCFPYRYKGDESYVNGIDTNYIHYTMCVNPDTTFRFERMSTLGTSNKTSKAKEWVIKSPFSMDVIGMQHVLSCIGYKIVQVGDTIYTDGSWYYYPADTITNNNPYIGQTAWLLKNSWIWYRSRAGNWPVIDSIGVRYMIVNENRIYNRSSNFGGKVFCNTITDKDIICSDADNDGYYFWGIGDKPAHCPEWAPDTPDGDDSSPLYGAMDEYGYLQEIGPHNKSPLLIGKDISFTTPQTIDRDITITSGATLTITSYLTMHPDAKILIQGGKLVLDGGTIRNGYIRNKGSLVIKNDGVVEMCGDDQFEHNPDDLEIINTGLTPFPITTTLKQSAFKRVNR